ncbi:MAG: VWA domain-containing protein [Candidatus Riflebacteria bacterium]|nr:VWA domain-containing protein [Candidatus Riflebacteria bacterium]
MLYNILSFLGLDAGSIRSISSFAVHFSWGWAGFLLALLAVLPLAWFTYRFEGKSVKESTKRKLLTLRIVWLVLVCFLLTGPTLVVSGWVPLQNRLAVMLDTSKSMSIKEGNETRFDKVKKIIQSGFLKKLEKKTGIYPDVFAFAENVTPISPSEIEKFNLKADGNQTAISSGLKNVVSHLGEGNLLGVIMLTDGVNTIGENPQNVLSSMRTPVYFVAPGRTSSVTDYALFIPKPPAFGYLNSNLRVRGEVSARITANSEAKEKIEVKVTKDGEIFEIIPVEVMGNGVKVPFSFNIPCKEEGSFRFEVEIPTVDGELTEENNKTAFLLKIVRERLNVLALSGLPNWDMKFITNALAGDPNASLTHWARITDDRWVCSKDFEVKNGTSEPNFQEEIKDADIIILNGIPHNYIKRFESDIIKRIESGKLGLLVMPSWKSLTQLGYKGTEIANILPVTVGEEVWRGTSGNMLLPSTETSYSFLNLADDPIENSSLMATLPKFDGIYEYESIKQSAEILLTSTVMGSKTKLPFMLRTRAGLGNIIMINGGPLWPIGFRLANSERGFSTYAGMIINMLKWLINRREDAQVSIELANSRGYVGASTVVKVWVSDNRHNLMQNARVILNINGEKGENYNLVCIETSEAGCYESTFIPASKGLHTIEAKASYQGKELGGSKVEFLVETPTAEFDDPIIKTDVMESIAKETGGLMVFDDETDKLIASLNSVPGKKLESKSIDIRDCWLLLILIILLPCLEWYYRRTGGLS